MECRAGFTKNPDTMKSMRPYKHPGHVMKWHIMRMVMAAMLVMMCRTTLADDIKPRDLMADTLVATDALGRTLPLNDKTGPPRDQRFVAVFYFLWLGHHGSYGPFDMTRIRAANPDKPLWGPLEAFHWWGQPELGYYLSNDEYVIRRHAHMLMDAGVDTVFLDATNAVVYTKEYMTLLRVFQQIRDEGGNPPRIAFFAHSSVIQRIYEELYKPNLYPGLWFRWDDKPLMLIAANPELNNAPAWSEEASRFFTFRGMWGLQRLTKPETWSFMQHVPQDPGVTENGTTEFMSVSMAQQETYMSSPTARGRSFHNGKQPAQPEWSHYGHNGAEQWERALQNDPKLIFITGWNEWGAMRFENAAGDTWFVDSWSEEFSKDIEPMTGGHTDSYYYQMVSFIRRFKGTRPLPLSGPPVTIDLAGAWDQWDEVTPAYLDPVNDTAHRNHPGFGSAGPYVDSTGRNDFVSMKVTYDDRICYFLAETQDAITPPTDPHWMLLFIDADQNPKTGWEGFDYLINAGVIDGKQTTVMKREGDKWVRVAEIPYRVEGNRLLLAVPRSVLGLADRLAFDFQWADNIQRLDDITALFLHGDTAPARRFRYRFQKNPTEP